MVNTEEYVSSEVSNESYILTYGYGGFGGPPPRKFWNSEVFTPHLDAIFTLLRFSAYVTAVITLNVTLRIFGLITITLRILV